MAALMSTIKHAVDDLFNNPQLSVNEAVERHYAPAFRQRTNGRWEDRRAVISRVSDLRAVIERVTITVLDELSDGQRYAERHVIDLVQRNGTRLRQEVYVFAERDGDGRFSRIEETTLMLDPPATKAGKSGETTR
jgi:hypothetical protein